MKVGRWTYLRTRWRRYWLGPPKVHRIVSRGEGTIDEFVTLVSRITYKPGWKITARPYYPSGMLDLSLETRLPDSTHGTQRNCSLSRLVMPETLHDEKHPLWIVAAHVREFEMHEMDEWLKLDGARVNDPHPRGA
jgi:hypothetical protein